MSTALNPFYDDDDEEEEEEEEEEENLLTLPDPCRTVSVADDTCQNGDNSRKPLESCGDIQSNGQPEPKDESFEDVLQLEVDKSELEELGGDDGDGNETKESNDVEEDVEIIEISVENNKKRKVEQTKDKVVSAAAVGASSEIKEEKTSIAKLVQFNKPGSHRQRSRVTSGVLEVVEGEYLGLKAAFQVGCCYVWGYHLARANLMYHLRAGDKFQVTVAVKEGVEVEEVQVPLIVKKAWLGVKSEVPEKSADNLDFAAWLIERNLTEEEFLLWLTDKLPPKPFFPLKSELYEAKVIMLIRQNPKGDGALVRITKDGDMKDNLAVFERDDFYLCGVHIGEADMRFLIKPGDTITVQVKEMSERERKARCKKFPKLDEFEFNQTCLLAYLGNHRPSGPSTKSDDNQELNVFLEQKGMSIEEFEKMRNLSEEREEVEMEVATTPPPGTSTSGVMTWLVNPQPALPLPVLPVPSPAVIPQIQAHSISQLDKISKCNQLVAKAIFMDENKRTNISELLSSEEEIELGYFLADIFTSSLVANVQNKVKAKLFTKMGAGAGETLKSMTRQLDMVNNQIIRNKPKQSEIIQVATDVAIAGAKPMSQAMAEAQQSTLAAIQNTPLNVNMVEAYDKQQQESRPDFASNKGILAMSDMKKRLEAFKAAKKLDQKITNSEKSNKKSVVSSNSTDIIEINENSKYRWDNSEALEEQGMDPLDLIRKYVRLGRKITMRGDKVLFRERCVPGETLTKLKISKNPGEVVDHYTVGCLAYFIQNIKDDHPEYVRKCICENIKCVRRPDRLNVQQYLTGEKDFVLNLDNQVTEYGSAVPSRTDTQRLSERRSRSRSRSRDRSRRSRSRSRRSRSRERRQEPSNQFRYQDSRMATGLNFKRGQNGSNGDSVFNQREFQLNDRQSDSFFVSQQISASQFQDPSEERQRALDQRPAVFGESRGWSGFDQRPARNEYQDDHKFSQYQGMSAFDQPSSNYQRFGSTDLNERQLDYGEITQQYNLRDRQVDYGRITQQYPTDSRFNSTRYDARESASQMNTHSPLERRHTYQKDEDLQYDRGFPPAASSSERDSGPPASQSLGPMFVIQSNNPPTGRRW